MKATVATDERIAVTAAVLAMVNAVRARPVSRRFCDEFMYAFVVAEIGRAYRDFLGPEYRAPSQ